VQTEAVFFSELHSKLRSGKLRTVTERVYRERDELIFNGFVDEFSLRMNIMDNSYSIPSPLN